LFQRIRHIATSVIQHRLARRRHRRHLKAVLACAHRLAAESLAERPRMAGGSLILSVVVPAYNTQSHHLDALLRSFHAQKMADAELILVDDGSPDAAAARRLAAAAASGVRTLRLDNRGIAGACQAGLEAARGRYVTFVDHDDALAPHALPLIARTLEENPACRLLYTDEVITDANLEPEDIFAKPAWDLVLLSGVNYVNHLAVYERARLETIGLRTGFDGSQDYDLLLRYAAGLEEAAILHLPYPAYLWRRDGKTYSALYGAKATEAARQALAERFGAPTAPAQLIPDLHRLSFDPALPSWPERWRGRWPRVSCIMPNRDAPELAAMALSGLLERTDYPDLEVIVPDNGTTDPATLALYEQYRARWPGVTVSIEPGPFDFAGAINRGVAMASGEVLLLINNDIEVEDPGWLKEMISCFAYGDVGIVGAKLLYPDRRSQHLGVIVGFGGYAGHWFMQTAESFPGPMGRLAVRQSLSAVTGACLAISRVCWEAAGPMDQARFKVAYNDVDLCMNAGAAGFRVVWTPFAQLIHHESASRGSDETPENRPRFDREKAALRERHGTDRFEDPALNPWLTTDRSYPEFRMCGSLPQARTSRLAPKQPVGY